jgi:hypothetical protein
MGRTVLSFTQELYREEASWRAFRRALRREDRELFDELFAAARYHTAACACSGRAVPFEAILMSILLEERRAVRELAARLDALARRMAALAEEIPDNAFDRAKTGD